MRSSPALAVPFAKWLPVSGGPANLRRMRWIPLFPLLIAALSLPAWADSPVLPPPAATSPAWVVPPGQEALVQRLVQAPGLPAATTIRISGEHIEASWPDGRTLTLSHPDTGSGGRTTARFRMQLAGPWPETVATALVAHVRSLEDGFRWLKTSTTDAAKPRQASRLDSRALDLALQEAGKSLRIGEKDKAIRKLREGLRAPEPSPLGLARVGAMLRQLAEPDGKALYEKALAELNARAVAPDARAEDRVAAASALALSDAAAALQAAKTRIAALPADSTETCSWAEVARSLEQEQHVAAAAELSETVRNRAPGCRLAWLQSIGCLPGGVAGWQRRLASVEAALKRFPDDLDLMFARGSALHDGWKNREAAAAWELVAAKNLQYPGILGMTATAYTQLPEVHDDAFLATFEERIRKNPKDVVARYVKGTIHYYRGEYQAVVDALDPLLKEVPDEPRIYLYTSMSLFNLGRVAEADARFALLGQKAHDDADYYYCRSVMLRQRDFEQSLRDLETFERLSRNRQNSDAKNAKIARELEVMRSGRAPNAFDVLPTPVRYGIGLGGAALVLGLGIWFARRRKSA